MSTFVTLRAGETAKHDIVLVATVSMAVCPWNNCQKLLTSNIIVVSWQEYVLCPTRKKSD